MVVSTTNTTCTCTYARMQWADQGYLAGQIPNIPGIPGANYHNWAKLRDTTTTLHTHTHTHWTTHDHICGYAQGNYYTQCPLMATS